MNTATREYLQDTDSDTVTCMCGNAAHLDGFYPCNAVGIPVPSFSSNDPEYWSHVVCVGCGRVAPSGSGSQRVIATVDPNALSEPE